VKSSGFYGALQRSPSFSYVTALEQPIEYRRPVCRFSPFFPGFFFASGIILFQKISPIHYAGRWLTRRPQFLR
ncbi:MAG: hypothetical protein MR562_10710, partial [Clostridiaceae bacterium]|nr:hypothetical protein [Clostridiaceae bacterium]